MTDSLCERCYYKKAVDTWKFESEMGEEKEIEVCGRCRHDLINGGRTFLNHSEAYQEQLERHRSDPLWEEHPKNIQGDN